MLNIVTINEIYCNLVYSYFSKVLWNPYTTSISWHIKGCNKADSCINVYFILPHLTGLSPFTVGERLY